MRRLTILLAMLGALLLLPATQAFGSFGPGAVKFNVTGSGSGEISSAAGLEGSGFYKGSPVIECKYKSPGPATGACENQLEDLGEGAQVTAVVITPGPGSAVSGQVTAAAHEAAPNITFGGGSGSHCIEHMGEKNFGKATTEPFECWAIGSGTEPETLEVNIKFECEVEGGCGEPTGPTNLRTLTLTKSGNGPGGTGSVSSKPKGIKCGTTCTEAVAAEYKNTPVTLTEKPGGESTFVEWTGACSGSSPTCTVPMAEDEAVGAVFAGTSKTITPAEPLTLEKSGSGKGTVKAAGLGCEAECTSTTVLYQGPITEPKAKPGKTVVLKQAPAFGSSFSGWSGCDSVDGEGNCVVEMDEAHSVSAEYTALPNKSLTVNKPYSSGNGSVASKPKGIKCGTACTQAVAQMPEGASVELTAKPGSETTFVHWVGGDCAGSTNPVCTVTMNADETTEAVFSKASKALAGESEATLTLNKGEGSGFGTVKASGLGCEWLCTSTSVVYQGPVTEPKAKPGKVVVLKAASAPGSKKVVWTGCDSIDGEGNCVIEMDEDHTVSASFDELE